MKKTSQSYWTNGLTTFYQADARSLPLEDLSVNCVVTSPPYWGLRDYGVDNQIGLEPTPELYVEHIVEVFREVRRVLRDDGTLWLNLGDSYASGTGGDRRIADPTSQHWSQTSIENRARARPPTPGLKPKDLVGMPWKVAFALQTDGWYLRSDIIWSKPNPMPESVTDRPTRSHEFIFLLTKNPKYYYDADAIKEPALYADAVVKLGTKPHNRNKRTVWEIPTQPYPEAHLATYPEKLVQPCVLAGCPPKGTVLDPFSGAGTTAVVAQKLGRLAIGVELNPDYLHLATLRLLKTPIPLS